MSEMFEAADEIIDELFPPVPGGLVDRHRQRKAQEKAAEQEAQQAAEAIEERSYKAVKVAIEQPESLATQTVAITAGATAMILPTYAYRKRAVVISSAPVYLGKDQGAVLTAAGLTSDTAPGNFFYLPASVPLVVESRAQLWCGAPTAAFVAVYSEFYGPEK
jgi:hypothetical protein